MLKYLFAPSNTLTIYHKLLTVEADLVSSVVMDEVGTTYIIPRMHDNP